MAVSLLQVEIIYAFLAAIGNVLLALKLYTRIRYIGGLQIDDYLVIVAYIFMMTAMALTYVMLENGLRTPSIMYIFLGFDKLTRLLKSFWIALQMFAIGILFNKLTLIFLYKRICSRAPTLSRLNTMLTILTYVCVIFSIFSVILNCFYCTPIKAFWTPMPLPNMLEYCPAYIPKLSVYSWQGFNMLSDIIIMIIPYFLLSQASFAHRSQLYALYALFGLGILVIASSLIKVIGIARMFEPETLVMWSFIEGIASFSVACLPSLPPLIWTRRRNRPLRTISVPAQLQMETVSERRSSERARRYVEIQKERDLEMVTRTTTGGSGVGDLERHGGIWTVISVGRSV